MMNKKLAEETLQELTRLQRHLDVLLGMADDEDCDPSDFLEIFMKKFYYGPDYTLTCSKAKGLISAMNEK